MSRVNLGEVARESKLKAADGEQLPTVGLEHLDPGDVELHRWDESKESTFTKRFLPGQVLFGRRRAYLQKAVVAPFEGVCSGDITVIEAIAGKISERLLPFVVQNPALFDFAVEKSAGSLSPRVKWARLSEFEFDLPSESEQEELANTLWASQRVKSHYRALIQASDDLVKSRFIEMFGDPSDNPFDWPARKLSTIGSLRNGVNFKANDKGFEIRSLGVSDFKDRSEIHDMELISKVEMSNPPRPTQLLQDGDVVFVRSNGNKELVGRCLAVYPGETPLTFSGFCISFRNETPSLALGYLLGFFKAQSTREKMRGRGANIQNLNQQILGELDVPMPPIELQQEFCGFVRQVDKSKFALQKTLDDLDAMTRKLMSEELGLGNV